MIEQKTYKIGFLFYVRYFDHLLFKNVDSRLCKPVMREVVGWLVKENDEAIWIVCDRSIEKVSARKFKLAKVAWSSLNRTCWRPKKLVSYLDSGSNEDPTIFFYEGQSISNGYLENFPRVIRYCHLIPFSYFTSAYLWPCSHQE